MKRKLSPQEKKLLSLERDRRGDYGDNNKASRKAIPLRKRIRARSYRRTAKQQIPQDASLLTPGELGDAEIDVLAVSPHRDPWKKWPNVSLGDWIVERHERRAKRAPRPVDE